jgi:hypothetical protein
VLIAGVLTSILASIAGAQSSSLPAAEQKSSTDQKTSPEVTKQLEELKQRVEQLEGELKKTQGPAETQVPAPSPDVASTAPILPASLKTPDGKALDTKTKALGSDAAALTPQTPIPLAPQAAAPAAPAASPTPQGGPQSPEAPATPPVDLDTPFAYADFTWMLSNPRNHDEVLDGKYFSGEFRVDTNYMYDYNHPGDHTLTETTEGERTGEFIIQALNIGGDFHAGNMQGRILTQFGAVSTAVPRNDASYSVGQWQLNDAYRYLSEMYAGYHVNVNHGLNFQVGDFLSYIGLFSYYSFDNWTYQPSYVSSNTPWFFTGARIQWFPTNKLKIEPWYINGWQTYAKYNARGGIGGQVLWRPTGNLDFVWNTYTLGRDTLGVPKRSRYHADWSQEWKFYENPSKLMHRMAMTVTEDFGCETGGGVVCKGGNATTPAQNFLGIMAYQRMWFHKDLFAFSYGGGVVNNPGRYLVLLPPINGANATTGSPYFPEAPGLSFKAYDYQLSFDYMPSQWVTWKVEFTQRGANVPVFTGPGGITPPGYNNGFPGQYACMDGVPSPAATGCGNDGGLWTPDMRKQERRLIFALMVKL